MTSELDLTESTMRAHVLRKFGKSNAVLAFEERGDSTLGPGEVRVDVEAAALNPVDLKTRGGKPKMLLPSAPPFVLGSDLERARALGVSHPIDYRTQRFEDAVRDMDFVFDTVGSDTFKRSWRVVKRGGVVASLHVPPPADLLVDAGLRAPWILRLLLPLITRGAYAGAAKARGRIVLKRG